MSRQASPSGGLKITRYDISLALKTGEFKNLVGKVYTTDSAYSQVDFVRSLIAFYGKEDDVILAIKDQQVLSAENMEKLKTEVRKAVKEDSAVKIPTRKKTPKEQWDEDWPILGDAAKVA